jgi:hypothetical protein
VVTVVWIALGLVAVAIAGAVLQPVWQWLEPFGAWAPVLWFGLLLVASYLVLSAFEWVIGGLPSARRRPPSVR